MIAEETYSPAARAMHWAGAALVLVVFASAWAPVGEDSELAGLVRLHVHRLAGMLVWLLTLARLLRRQLGRSPALPAALPAWQRIAARVNLAVLYALLLAQPLLGLVASQAAGDTVAPFGLFTVPTLVGRNRALAHACFAWHETVATLLLALVALHVAAALYHHMVRRDGVLAGMLPALRRMDARPGG